MSAPVSKEKNKVTRFDKLADRFNAVMKEPDFLTKAEKLLLLKEEALVGKIQETKRLEKLEKLFRSKTAGKGTTTLFSCMALGGIAALLPFSFLPSFGAFCLIGLAGGALVSFSNFCKRDMKLSPQKELLEKQSERLMTKIDNSILAVEEELISQPNPVKGKYRAAFKHAALRQAQLSQVLFAEKAEKAAANQNQATKSATTAANLAATAAVISVITR